jgi:hypothetical protein
LYYVIEQPLLVTHNPSAGHSASLRVRHSEACYVIKYPHEPVSH